MNIHRKRGKYTVGTLFRKGSIIFSISRNLMLQPPYDYIIRIMRIKVKRKFKEKYRYGDVPASFFGIVCGGLE